MSDLFLSLAGGYGLWAVMISAFLSCLLVPIPTSVMMLTAGALAAVGDLVLAPLMLAAFAGAVTGDQAGYWIGRRFGAPALARLDHSPARRAVLARARRLIARRGGIGVFLSRWALAPLGPYVNLVAGAGGLTWGRFTAWDVAGEALWVTLYVGAGYAFSDNIAAVAEVSGDLLGLAVALVVAGVAALWLRATLRAQKAR